MTTEATATKEPHIPKRTPLEPLQVKRNEAEIEFTDTEVHRGDEKGWPFLQPVVNLDNLDTVIAWIGRDNVAGKLGGMLRQLSQGWYEEAETQATDKETGKVNLQKCREVFTEMAQAFSARGESIPDLKNRIEELTNMMVDLDMGEDTDLKKFAEYAKEIKSLQVAVASKKRERKSKTAPEGQTAEATA
jgi:hypothetical protein